MISQWLDRVFKRTKDPSEHIKFETNFGKNEEENRQALRITAKFRQSSIEGLSGHD